jgi:DNA-binding SARP family transcriptional activator
VLTRGDALELNAAVPVWVDTHVFRGLYELAGSLWRRGQFNEAVRTYEAVDQLYRDDYLLDDVYEEWTVIHREQLKDQYLLVVTRLADAALRTGDYDTCVEYSHKILARDAFREDAYQRLIRCHAKMGRPARALRWFELCREMLERELSVTPSEQTVQLAESVKHGTPTRLFEVGEPFAWQARGGAAVEAAVPALA